MPVRGLLQPDTEELKRLHAFTLPLRLVRSRLEEAQRVRHEQGA